MARDPSLPPSIVVTFRIDPEALMVLNWWASYVGPPLRSMVRQALEDIADEILASYAPDVDPALPDGVLLKRLRHILHVPQPVDDTP